MIQFRNTTGIYRFIKEVLHQGCILRKFLNILESLFYKSTYLG